MKGKQQVSRDEKGSKGKGERGNKVKVESEKTTQRQHKVNESSKQCEGRALLRE